MTIGWDVGGVQVKAARVESRAGSPPVVRTAVRAFEIWRGRDRLAGILRELAEELSVDAATPHALTMTAELSDAFRDKREGVLFVMDGAPRGLPRQPSSSRSTATAASRRCPRRAERPLAFAATNWLASALLAASRVDDCILVDVGSTTTDIVPIRGGRLACEGTTDLDRLIAGELVYTGVLRTNPNTLTATVPVRGRPCRVAAEHFAVMADAYLLLGRISAEDYACPTPDGRGVSPTACRRTPGAPRLRRSRDAQSSARSSGSRAMSASDRCRSSARGFSRSCRAGTARPRSLSLPPAPAPFWRRGRRPPRPRRAAPGRPLGSRGHGLAGRRRRPPPGGAA